ncbi:MAG: helix-turn-helix transcriptional regulator [Bacteroidota bacterium]
MTTKEDRIKQVRKHFNLSKKQFAEIIGMSEITIVKIESGENKVGAVTQRNFLKAFPHVNKDWFILGLGSMLTEEYTTANEDGVVYPDTRNMNDSDDVIIRGGKVYMDITSAFKSYFDDIDFINHMFSNKQNSWRPTVEKLSKIRK